MLVNTIHVSDVQQYNICICYYMLTTQSPLFHHQTVTPLPSSSSKNLLSSQLTTILCFVIYEFVLSVCYFLFLSHMSEIIQLSSFPSYLFHWT